MSTSRRRITRASPGAKCQSLPRGHERTRSTFTGPSRDSRSNGSLTSVLSTVTSAPEAAKRCATWCVWISVPPHSGR